MEKLKNKIHSIKFLIITTSVFVLFFLVIFSYSYSSNLSQKEGPIGKWNEIGGTETMEFNKDGRVIITDHGMKMEGKYTIVNSKTLRLELGGMYALMGPMNCNFSISEGVLKLTVKGKLSKYKKVGYKKTSKKIDLNNIDPQKLDTPESVAMLYFIALKSGKIDTLKPAFISKEELKILFKEKGWNSDADHLFDNFSSRWEEDFNEASKGLKKLFEERNLRIIGIERAEPGEDDPDIDTYIFAAYDGPDDFDDSFLEQCGNGEMRLEVDKMIKVNNNWKILELR